MARGDGVQYGPYDEDWRRSRQWLRATGGLALHAVRQRRVADAAGLVVVMVVNPVLLAVGPRWRRRSCPCCGWQGVSFLWLSYGLHLARDVVCPHCESRPRHRGLAVFLPATIDPPPATILHFAPEARLSEILQRSFPEATYVTTDLAREDVDLPGQDIQHLDLPDGGYDLVVCNHVLEHVPDDHAAVAELGRVTTPGGTAIVSVPGRWDGTPTHPLPEVDQNGHIRRYGLDLSELLETAFPRVRTVAGADLAPNPTRLGVRLDEPIFLCTREPPADS